MRTHAKVVAWVFLVYGVAGLALAAGAFLLYAGLGTGALLEDGDVASGAVGFSFGLAIGGVLAALSLPNAIAGWGLLRRRAWGRPLGIALAILNLFFAPIGTLFGAYALVALFAEDAPPERREHASLAALLDDDDGVRPAAPLVLLAALLVLACAALTAMALLATPAALLLGVGTTEVIAAVLGGLGALAIAFAVRRAMRARRVRVAARQRVVIRALAAEGGRITVLAAARRTGLTADECEDALDDLARKNHVELDVARGRQVYRAL